MKRQWKQATLAVAVASAMGSVAGSASAAGFALIEQSASGMGNAFAGAAATAEDASTIFYNPAGMSKLSGPQFAVAGHAIDVSLKFSNNGSSSVPGPLTGGDGGNAGGVAFVPNGYFVMPVNDRWTVGLGVNAPFGLKTDYDSDWVGRFQGIKTEVSGINYNPAVSYKISDNVSVGFGIDYQKFDAELTNAIFTGGPEATSKLDASDDGWGWNAGVLAQLTPTTRVGVSYRSKIHYKLEGTNLVSAPVNLSNSVQTDLTVPDMASLSAVQKLGDSWDLLGDVTYTRWDSIDTLTVVNSANGSTLDTLPLKFRNTWRASLGANYYYSEKWTFKGGLAWDQTPVQDQYRTVRLPDNDRKWLAVGAKYRVTNSAAIDMGYAHLFISNASINNTSTQASGFTSTVVGNYTGSIDIFSLQYTQSF
ncbi:MAG TPA: OmpP1/FadL family transporter [Burkholderiales bacterium]|nr:OmpP1/FadL family transporter [Burkholderiales bacterium]